MAIRKVGAPCTLKCLLKLAHRKGRKAHKGKPEEFAADPRQAGTDKRRLEKNQLAKTKLLATLPN